MQKKSARWLKWSVLFAVFLLSAFLLYTGPKLFREFEFSMAQRSFTVRPYYFTSILLILGSLAAFFVSFEKKRPPVREVVILSVLTALAVAGRAACFMLPQVAPMGAIVILTGACLGGQSGFLVGAMSAFVSNFFFGQGPWTPWQMFSFGLLGLLAGMLYHAGKAPKKVWSLCLFGALSTLVLYGGLMNLHSAMMFSEVLTKGVLVATFAAGFPFDLVHSLSTGLFLLFLTKPMVEKLDRIKTKYGILETE